MFVATVLKCLLLQWSCSRVQEQSIGGEKKKEKKKGKTSDYFDSLKIRDTVPKDWNNFLYNLNLSVAGIWDCKARILKEQYFSSSSSLEL